MGDGDENDSLGGDVSPERPQSPDTKGFNDQEAAAGEENNEEHEWSAFYDASGQLYYYNNATQESSWEAPEKFNPPPPPEDDDGAAAAETTTTTEEQDQVEESNANDADAGSGDGADGDAAEDEDDDEGRPIGGGWVAHLDDEGREYYYNAESGETQWEKPEIEETTLETTDDTAAAVADKEQKDISSQQQQSNAEATEPMDVDEAEQKDEEAKEIAKEEIEPEEEEEKEDPEVKKLANAKTAINETDSIMEPSCSNNVRTLWEGGVKIPEILQSLVKSYQGQTAMCSLLAEWLVNLKKPSAVGPSTKNVSDSVRDIIEDVLVKIVKEHFTKERGDHIFDVLKGDKSERAMLDQMIKSDRWRKLLIDLSASNKDSVLLEVCLVQISNAGHHREIARRINASDHFAVYNGMVAAEFAVIGEDRSTDLYKLMADLKRSCTSAPHTYLYATKVLDALLEKVKSSSEADTSHLNRARRKWERVREELEGAMIDPASAAGSSPLFKKRRLDVALTISDLYQRQRRRPVPSSTGDEACDGHSNKNNNNDSLENALLNLLRRQSLGTRLDDRLLDQLLHDETSLTSTKGEVGKLLIAHPLAIKVLLSHLFKPGSSRVGSVETRQKCARLVALAVVAAENAAIKEVENRDLEERKDELSLMKTILSGSDLCEKVENMVSFTVTSDVVNSDPLASPGMKLSSLALKNASVAQGVVMWACAIAAGSEFVSSASYPTLSPSLLSLLRLISGRHPFTRRDVIETAFVFLKHQNSEISVQKMTDLKQQSLRLLLSLLVKGEVVSVLGELKKRMEQQGKMEIDTSLVRYFVGGMLDIYRPPYSLALIRSTSQLFLAPQCVEALKSSYLGDSNKKRLATLIASFKLSISNMSHSTSDDEAIVSSLVSTYK